MSRSFAIAFLMSLAILTVGPVANAADTDLDKWLRDARLGPHLPEKEDWNMVIEKAKQEGTVIVYSSTSRTGRLKKLFEKTYPGVTLEAFKVETMQIIEKFSREQKSGIFNADVIFNDAVAEMKALYDQGSLVSG